MPRFVKKPFRDRLKDTGFLLKHSFSIVGKDQGIAKPTIRMAILTGSIITCVFLSLLTFLLRSYVLLGIVLLLFTLVALLPYRIFFDVRQKAGQSWMTYQALKGNGITYKDALAHARSQRSSLRKIAFVDLLVRWTSGQRGGGKGVGGVLITIFLAALREVWDLLSHYLYPAVVIEGKPLKETVPGIKMLQDNVPATLTGVFGIDFAGGVISSILVPIYLLFLAVGVGIGSLVSLATESTVVTAFGVSFSWVPVFVMLYLVFLLGGVVKKIVESVKVIYFTIFYVAITRPKEITAIPKEDVTHYLLMDKSARVAQELPAENPSSGDPHLDSAVRRYLEQGNTSERISAFLVSKGYSVDEVDAALHAAQKHAG